MKPNIVLLILDALRAKNLSLYGYPEEHDTNMRKIAGESIFFRNCFTCANATHASMTSLFSAKYPINAGIIHTYPNIAQEEYNALRKNKFWVPIYLKNLGYQTHYMYTGGMPWLKKGFTYVREKPKQDAYRKINNKVIVRKILKKLPDSVYFFLKKMFRRDPKIDFPKLRQTVDVSIEKMKESKKAKKPFFTYIHFAETHYPWAMTPTRKEKAKSGKSLRQILKELPTAVQKKYVKRRMRNSDLESTGQIVAKYNDSIKSIDNEIGRLCDFLKKEKLWENTIFIVASDHGFSLDEHNIYLNHTGLYDESIHIPLMIRFPKLKPKQVSGLVQNIDIFPTILDFLKQKKVKEIDGKSLLPLIKNNKSARDHVYSFDANCEKRWSVRNNKKKVIFGEKITCFACKGIHGQQIEEYDLKTDPNELKNIVSEKRKLKDYDLNLKL